jgi:hypothetical protein
MKALTTINEIRLIFPQKKKKKKKKEDWQFPNESQ